MLASDGGSDHEPARSPDRCGAAHAGCHCQAVDLYILTYSQKCDDYLVHENAKLHQPQPNDFALGELSASNPPIQQQPTATTIAKHLDEGNKWQLYSVSPLAISSQ